MHLCKNSYVNDVTKGVKIIAFFRRVKRSCRIRIVRVFMLGVAETTPNFLLEFAKRIRGVYSLAVKESIPSIPERKTQKSETHNAECLGLIYFSHGSVFFYNIKAEKWSASLLFMHYDVFPS